MRSSLARWDGDRVPPGRPEGRRAGSGRTPPEDNVFLSLSPDRAKVLGFLAARTSSFTVVIVVAVVLATLLAAGSSMTGASGAIAAGWLAVHQVPLVIGKTSLGLLPLLPTGVLMWFVARDCARAVELDATRADLGWIVGAAVAGPLVITAVCLAVAEDASAVVALQPPATLAAFGWVGGLHLLAAVAGIASRANPLRERLFAGLPDWVAPGARAALRALLRLLAAAAAVTVISLLAHWSRIGDTYGAAGNAAGVFGLTLLSVLYLPNIAIDAAGLLVGADVHIGTGALSVFSVGGAPVPGLPILAAVPAGPAAGWWPVLLLAPAAIGVWTGMDCARTSYDEIRAPWATLTAAGLSALATVVLGALAGGTVGSFGYIGPAVWPTAALVVAWLAVPGLVGLVCARWLLPSAGPFVHDRYADAADGYRDGYADAADGYPDGYADAADGYRDEYADAADGYPDDEYADGYYDDYDDYAEEDTVDGDVVEGELVEEQPSLSDATAPRPDDVDEPADIVDAEVVEADLPDSGGTGGR
ncbi:cell division protein PerM [Nocardia thraciensis]